MQLTLGIDSSTQGVKAVAWDVAAEKVAFSASVNYGRDLPEYGSPDGFLPNGDVLVRHADPRMWIDGLELVLKRLQESGCPMGDIVAIGGDAQQHATVYLAEEGLRGLRSLGGGDVSAAPSPLTVAAVVGGGGAAETTVRGLRGSGGSGSNELVIETLFSRKTSPIWMDSSTAAEVAALNRRFPDMAARTGSPAIERFAATQIMKFAKADPAAYARTKRIHLLSSFLASYLVGEDMPIDAGDGAGMNLLNLRTGEWDDEICEFVASGLRDKLPATVTGMAATSSKSPYHRPLRPHFMKCGLNPGIPVVPFTGDNSASLVGCFAEKPGTAVISLGTSDVFFAAMDSFHVDPDGCGHVFGNPTGGFLSLSCFKNGSLARDRIRRELGVDWKFFDEGAWEKVEEVEKIGAGGGERRRIAFPYFEAEITPKHAATGVEANFNWDAADPATKVRAVVRGQVENMYERTRWIGTFGEIKITGGASRSKGIRETIASVFGTKVTVLDVADSAAVGGARLAAQVLVPSTTSTKNACTDGCGRNVRQYACLANKDVNQQ